jgi:hypothetical protein
LLWDLFVQQKPSLSVLPNVKGKYRKFAHANGMTPPGFWQAHPQKSGERRPFGLNGNSDVFRAYTVLICLKNMLTGSHVVYEWGGRKN